MAFVSSSSAPKQQVQSKAATPQLLSPRRSQWLLFVDTIHSKCPAAGISGAFCTWTRLWQRCRDLSKEMAAANQMFHPVDRSQWQPLMTRAQLVRP